MIIVILLLLFLGGSSLRRFIHSTNRAQSSFRVGMNHLADYLRNEVQSILGHKPSPGPNGGLPFPAKLYAGVEPPENLDWRLYGRLWRQCFHKVMTFVMS